MTYSKIETAYIQLYLKKYLKCTMAGAIFYSVTRMKGAGSAQNRFPNRLRRAFCGGLLVIGTDMKQEGRGCLPRPSFIVRTGIAGGDSHRLRSYDE